jgi:hypothetical protein
MITRIIRGRTQKLLSGDVRLSFDFTDQGTEYEHRKY